MINATKYDRLSGYFSSSIYYIIWDVLQEFISNNGKIRLVCSPNLLDEDVDALKDGEMGKNDEILAESLNKTFNEMLSNEETLIPAKLLACMVSNGILEIKFAILPRNHVLYHDKVGTFGDDKGNIVGFRGSMNETFNGLSSDGNIESVDVFISWEDKRDADRAYEAQEAFDEIWEDRIECVYVYTLPQSIKNKLLEISSGVTIPELLAEYKIKEEYKKKSEIIKSKKDSRVPRDHQVRAIEDWINNNRRGILEHATGSGKTFTAILTIRDSLLRGNEVPLILVPSTDLLNQWVGELKSSLNDLNPVILSCDGEHPTWKDYLTVISSPPTKKSNPHIIVSTLQTASTDKFLKEIQDGNHLFLIADEVHRCGSQQFRSVFNILSGPRLGLSATPKRYGDPEGTAAIYQYFERTVNPKYSLGDAIQEQNLSPYYYYPYTVELTPKEQEEWINLSKKIRKEYAIAKNCNKQRNSIWAESKIKNDLIQRSRILKNAEVKIPRACEILHTYTGNDKWLVYCDSISQLNKLRDELLKDHFFAGVQILVYHSRMEREERNRVLKTFSMTSSILLSVKCLDEGVNIPAASHALILASSKNPREFIQRRGRILRQHTGKYAAYLYDIIVSPLASDKDEDNTISITKSELVRALEFAKMAINSSDSIGKLNNIAIDNNVNLDTIDDCGYDEERYDDDTEFEN